MIFKSLLVNFDALLLQGSDDGGLVLRQSDLTVSIVVGQSHLHYSTNTHDRTSSSVAEKVFPKAL